MAPLSQSTTGSAATPASAAAAATSPVAMAKLVIMGAIMYGSRSWDKDDAVLVHKLRMAYGVVHCILVTVVLVTYAYVSRIHNTNNKKTFIFIPAPPQPFSDDSAQKKKYTRVVFETHALTAARNLIGSTLFGMAMTCGLHWYKGMVTGLAMQTVLSPLTTYDSPIIKAVWTSLYQQMFSSSTTTTKSTTLVTPEHRWFGEKLSLQELDPETEQAVDEQGNPIEIVGTGRITNNTNNANASTTTKGQPKPRSVQDIMLDTWDQGPNADVSELSAALFVDKKDPLVITTTINDLWTPLMILCGLASDNVAATETRRKLIKQQEKDGADALLKAVDTDGWTALHWAAFHGNVTAADDLFQLANKNDTVTSVLVHARDKDDKTPVEIAQQEGNMDVVHIIQEQMKLKGGADISTTTAEPKKEK